MALRVAPVSSLATMTDVPAIALPVESATVPETAASPCARALPGMQERKNKPIATRKFSDFIYMRRKPLKVRRRSAKRFQNLYKLYQNSIV
jgi:hypothetical protein